MFAKENGCIGVGLSIILWKLKCQETVDEWLCRDAGDSAVCTTWKRTVYFSLLVNRTQTHMYESVFIVICIYDNKALTQTQDISNILKCLNALILVQLEMYMAPTALPLQLEWDTPACKQCG